MNLQDKQAAMLERNTAPATPDILTVQQVADRLQVSTTWVIRKFQDEPGVLILGSPVTTRNKRRRRVLRIPIGVYNRVIHRLTRK